MGPTTCDVYERLGSLLATCMVDTDPKGVAKVATASDQILLELRDEDGVRQRFRITVEKTSENFLPPDVQKVYDESRMKTAECSETTTQEGKCGQEGDQPAGDPVPAGKADEGSGDCTGS